VAEALPLGPEDVFPTGLEALGVLDESAELVEPRPCNRCILGQLL